MHNGFTIIEVMLFLAISGFLFVGIVAGAGSNISRQRYQTSVQDLAEFLREQYSTVSNIQISSRDSTGNDVTYCAGDIMSQVDSNWRWQGPPSDSENAGRGRSDCLVYGKIIVFGDSDGSREGGSILSYSVLGKDFQKIYENMKKEDKDRFDANKDQTKEALKLIQLSPFVSQPKKKCSLNYSNGQPYSIEWDARAESPRDNSALKKTVLIIRSPIDGAIHTYVHEGALEISKVNGKNLLSSDGSGNPGSCGDSAGTNLSYLSFNPNLAQSIDVMSNISSFSEQTVEICVGSDDLLADKRNQNRRMIRLISGGHNSSAVELMDRDSLRPESDPELGGQPWCM